MRKDPWTAAPQARARAAAKPSARAAARVGQQREERRAAEAQWPERRAAEELTLAGRRMLRTTRNEPTGPMGTREAKTARRSSDRPEFGSCFRSRTEMEELPIR